jgi:AraC-like DNA-binding protein
MVNTRNNTTEAIPVHRIALLRPVVRLLTDVGTPVERCFRQVGLPWYALEDVDNYVPSQRFYKFLVSTAYSEGIMDLGFRVGKKFGADCADPHMTKLLKNAPTLYQGLLKASERINQTVTHVRFGILQPANCRYAYFYMHPSCKVDNPAIEQVGWYGITILLGMVRAYTGPQWQPTEIGVPKDRMPCGYIREHFPHTRIRLSQPFCYIALENAVLSLPPFQDEAARLASSLNDYRKIPEDFVSSLELVLLSYLQEGNMSIELAAELCNTSKRTLQRKLKEVGTHYNEVVDHARFRATSRMLQDANMTVNDIRYRLGYSNVANFARSFQRIAGVTPQVYRQQFNHRNRR